MSGTKEAPRCRRGSCRMAFVSGIWLARALTHRLWFGYSVPMLESRAQRWTGRGTADSSPFISPPSGVSMGIQMLANAQFVKQCQANRHPIDTTKME